MDDVDVVGMLEKMAENGHAPEEGCSLFGVGYDDAFHRIREKYLVERFARGHSAEKFVVGPFGAGKTHFLRQVMEMARDLNCVTAEVPLTRDVDFTQNLVTYREIVREIRAPNGTAHGMRALLMDLVRWVGAKAPPEMKEKVLNAWVAGLSDVDFKLESYGRIAKKALLANLAHDEVGFEAACRWMSGEFGDKQLCREIGASAITRSEEGLYGRRALLSLFQLIRHAGYAGTVVGLDEAEQGLSVDRRKMQKILSMLQSGINAMSDLEGGSAMIMFALTPDLVEKMEEFPALQQRVSDPMPGRGFLQGDTLAPKIDLSVRGDADEDLRAIGAQLVNLLYSKVEMPTTIPVDDVRAVVERIADDVALNEVQSGNRRTMVKRTCSLLLNVHERGELVEPPTNRSEVEPEV